jgi:hypothetical protein
MSTNLPPPIIEDSAQATKLFFDSYGEAPLEFPANDVEGTISFFQSRGFDRDAAEVTAMTILKQAKLDNIPVFQLLDTLGKLGETELSALIGEILNNNRPSTSMLGFKFNAFNQADLKNRNVAA